MELFALFHKQNGNWIQLSVEALPLDQARKKWNRYLSQGARLQAVEGAHFEQVTGNANSALRDTTIQTALKGFREKVF